MKKLALLFTLLTGLAASATKSVFWVSFSDKRGSSFSFNAEVSERAIQRRIASGRPLWDSLDVPVSCTYLLEVEKLAGKPLVESRWLNGAAFYMDEKDAGRLSGLAFIRSVERLNAMQPCRRDRDKYPDRKKLAAENIALLKYQTERLGARFFRERGIDGRGVLIAVFDVGFPTVDRHPAFEHLRSERRIKATYDFVNKDTNVFHGNWHGTATLSNIAGRYDSLNMGLATASDFILAKTEQSLAEPAAEEAYWAAAAEWADRMGANIISSSLGYTSERYFNTDMNGHKSLVARAADIAASKGILVVNSAGNEGLDDWRFIATPADARSVLAVGGTNPETDSHESFSSFGPTSDGRVKPNVCAPARTVVAKRDVFSTAEGTSFSSPLVAGFAACVLQVTGFIDPDSLLRLIERSGSLYPYYDYAHGYGIPQAGRILHGAGETEPTFNFVVINNMVNVVLHEKFSYSETESLMGYASQRNLFYKIESKEGGMRSYHVLIAGPKEALSIDTGSLTQGDKVTVHFEGYTGSFDVLDTQ